MRANIPALPAGRGPPTFRLCGAVVHLTGDLHPGPNYQPSHNQLYIFDAALANDMRQNNMMHGLNRNVLDTIQIRVRKC